MGYEKVVQNQSELGEGSANSTDPHYTPTIIKSSTQPQKTQKHRKPKRKETHVPQPSDPSENVADEDVHKELGDSLVRASTTTSSLEAEQDSGNITKTRSKATPNESSSYELIRVGVPGNTLRSDEDRLKLDELMALCTTLQNRILDLEKTKTTQQNEIASLKRRVKKFEKKVDMDQDSAHMVAASKVPMLKPGKYEIWRIRIEQYIQMIDYALWEVIENGATLPKTTIVEGVMTEMPITT
ncbi:hypothetical protein Tco_0824217, partial [Tanacetum coccineum]